MVSHKAEWIGRYERKTRRRDKAAILNPKPPLLAKTSNPHLALPDAEAGIDAQGLSDQWWDDHRQRKRAIAPVPEQSPEPSGSRLVKKGVRKRIGTEVDTRKKERGKKSSIPGLEFIRNYKPSVPIPASRLTVSQPQTPHPYSSTPGWVLIWGIDDTWSIEGIVWEWGIIRSGPSEEYNRTPNRSVIVIVIHVNESWSQPQVIETGS